MSFDRVVQQSWTPPWNSMSSWAVGWAPWVSLRLSGTSTCSVAMCIARFFLKKYPPLVCPGESGFCYEIRMYIRLLASISCSSCPIVAQLGSWIASVLVLWTTANIVVDLLAEFILPHSEVECMRSRLLCLLPWLVCCKWFVLQYMSDWL